MPVIFMQQFGKKKSMIESIWTMTGFLKIISSLVKQRQDSIEQFKAGGTRRSSCQRRSRAQIFTVFYACTDGRSRSPKTRRLGSNRSQSIGPKDMGNVMKL